MRCFIERPCLLLLAACLMSCDGGPSAQPQVRIMLTCDVSGRIEPCGCFTGQMGGLTRLKTVLSSEKTPSLRLDAGDAIAGTADYEVIQYRHLLRSLGSLGYHAVNAGRREAMLNASTLTSLANESPVPLISANVTDATTSLPLLKPWISVEVGGVRHGIIGIVHPSSVGDGKIGAGLAISDPASAISAVLPEVRKAADVIVLLAFAKEDRMQELAAQFFELQVILGGDVEQPSQELVKSNRSLLLSTTNEGRAVAFLESSLVNGRLSDPKSEIVMLHEMIPQDEGVLAFVQAYRDEVRAAKLAVDDPQKAGANDVPGVKETAQYIGSESCAGCHAEDYKIWQQSGHARAWDALKRRESDADPNCIGCHSIGFGSASGYRREFNGSRLVEVGCESCHGPGGRHVAERTGGQPPLFKFRPLGAGDCTTCHHGEFSRPFEYAEFWQSIAHGKKKTAVNP
jgi:hypothetical protein